MRSLRSYFVLAAMGVVGLGAMSAVPSLRDAVPHAARGLTLAAPPADSAELQRQPEAAWKVLFGASGNLRAVIGTPLALREMPVLRPLLADAALDAPGVHWLTVPGLDGMPLVVVTMAPFAKGASGNRMQGYRVGQWPAGRRGATDARYSAPTGYIPVTAENAATAISKRFSLRDFLTHDQQAVWPKVLVLRPVLVDKLELIGDELERSGLPGRLHVMSGFRTPQYNAQGVGAMGGRASESRHMYGDAADIFVDANGDGAMDDLNGDGRVTVRDAQVLFAAAERVELSHPGMVGGLSAYPATSAHGPFVHVDVRGTRARW